MAFRNLLLVPFCLVALSPAVSQTSTFELHANGKIIGKASYAVAPAKQGFHLTSRYNFRMGAEEGDFADDFKVNPQYGFLEGTTTDNNGQRRVSFLPNKTRTELSISSFLGGAEPTTFATIKPDFVILPNYDPGAAQVILLLATTHPTPDNKYNIFLPAGAGPPLDPNDSGGGGKHGRSSGAAPAAAADEALPLPNSAYDAVWVKGRDLTGSLDGKPLAVHTYLLAFGKAKWLFFADDANSLLQLNVSALHASYIRAKFKLDPIPAAATSSPAQTPSPPSR